MKETEKDVIEIMKKYVFGLLVAAMVMSLCACNLETNRKEQPTDDTTVESTVAIDKKEEAKQEEESEQAEVSVDLVGPWHLDSEKNDLNAFEEIFPAYAEFGAGMEIKSNGQMSWYIGAAGGCGSYSLTGDILHAELISDMEQTDMPMDFQVVVENETVGLKMEYQNMTVYWTYGDNEDIPAAGNEE